MESPNKRSSKFIVVANEIWSLKHTLHFYINYCPTSAGQRWVPKGQRTNVFGNYSVSFQIWVVD